MLDHLADYMRLGLNLPKENFVTMHLLVKSRPPISKDGGRSGYKMKRNSAVDGRSSAACRCCQLM